MMKIGKILMKRERGKGKGIFKLMRNKKNTIFGFFSEKYRKMSKKLKNDENGSDID